MSHLCHNSINILSRLFCGLGLPFHKQRKDQWQCVSKATGLADVWLTINMGLLYCAGLQNYIIRFYTISRKRRAFLKCIACIVPQPNQHSFFDTWVVDCLSTLYPHYDIMTSLVAWCKDNSNIRFTIVVNYKEHDFTVK